MKVVLCTLAATLFIQLGYFLWKLSADRQPRVGDVAVRVNLLAMLQDWRWVLGFICTSAGWVLFVQATAWGDISLVQPLMSVGDLLFVLMVVVFLHERLNRREIAGLALTAFGAALLSWGASVKNPLDYNSHKLWALMGLIIIIAVMVAMLSRRSNRQELPLALVVGLAFGSGASLTAALTARSATLAWLVLLDPLLIAVVAANVAGLATLQIAFQRGRASVVVPVQLAIANLVSVTAGVAVFNEVIDLQRALGITIIVGGTALLK